MSEAQRSKKVTGVSRVSEVSKMLKQGEQQSLHSLLPLGEGGRRPDEGLKRRAKDAQSQCPPLETLPSTNNPVDCLYERKGGRMRVRTQSALTLWKPLKADNNRYIPSPLWEKVNSTRLT